MKAPDWLVDRLRDYAWKQIRRRKPDFMVGDPKNPYMKRWFGIRTRFGGFYIHQFLKDDDDRALHDHPWRSISISLAGITNEVYAPEGTNPSDPDQHERRRILPRDVTYRSSTFAHRLELVTSYALTIFIFGPVVRKWGFWCPKGWKHWKDFVKPGAKGQIGVGCGED